MLEQISRADEPVLLRVGSSTVEAPAADVVTAALLGPLGDRDLRLVLGAHRPRWLEQTGLAFAIANRLGPTEVRTSDARHWSSDLLVDWSETWSNGDRLPVAEELFSADEWGGPAISPVVIGGTSAVFINAHRSPMDGARHPVTTQIWPWLDSLLPETRTLRRNSEARNLLLAEFGSLVDEAVANVAEHGAAASSDTYSMVRVSVSTGGTRAISRHKSSGRLHLSVLDTGPGILSTARPRALNPEAPSRGSAFLYGLLAGTVQLAGPKGHGQGLPRILRTARERGGRLTVWANDARCICGFGRGEHVRADDVNYDMRGTVLNVALPF